MIKDPGSTTLQQANRKNESRDVVASDDQANTHIVYGEFCFSYFFAKECLSLSESGSAALSKYILAVKIAEALSNTDDISGASPPGVIVVKEIDDRDFAPLLLQSRAYLSKYEESKQSTSSVGFSHSSGIGKVNT